FAIALFVAEYAVGQSGMSGGCSATSCTMKLRFCPFGILVGSAATGPYSGRESKESVQTLADGTHITTKDPLSLNSAMTYRDSQGRLRTERPMFPVPQGRKSPDGITLVEIQDPVAGYLYVLDSVNHVAHRVPIQPRKPIERPVVVQSPVSTGN